MSIEFTERSEVLPCIRAKNLKKKMKSSGHKNYWEHMPQGHLFFDEPIDESRARFDVLWREVARFDEW